MGVLVVTKLLLDAVEVEGVPDELVVDFAEELVLLEVAEPLDPSCVLLGAVLGFGRHPYLL